MSRIHSRWAFPALLAGLTALAAPPPEFTVQGVLRNSSGTLQSATVAVTASLFDAETGGNKIGGPYTKTGVPVTNGLFTLTLAEPTLPAIVAAAPAVWLELLVGNDTFPRTKITASLFAAQAADSQKLGGADATSWQKKLATADCGAGKRVQGVAQDGTVTCADNPSADGTSLTQTSGGVLSVAFAGTGTASTAARSDHTHGVTMSCVQVNASVTGTGNQAVTANCSTITGAAMTGGGCYSTGGTIRYSFPACLGVRCLCLPGIYCGPQWSCGSAAAASETLTAYAMCCTATAP